MFWFSWLSTILNLILFVALGIKMTFCLLEKIMQMHNLILFLQGFIYFFNLKAIIEKLSYWTDIDDMRLIYLNHMTFKVSHNEEITHLTEDPNKGQLFEWEKKQVLVNVVLVKRTFWVNKCFSSILGESANIVSKTF